MPLVRVRLIDERVFRQSVYLQAIAVRGAVFRRASASTTPQFVEHRAQGRTAHAALIGGSAFLVNTTVAQ